jgi:hypothetical protein
MKNISANSPTIVSSALEHSPIKEKKKMANTTLTGGHQIVEIANRFGSLFLVNGQQFANRGRAEAYARKHPTPESRRAQLRAAKFNRFEGYHQFETLEHGGFGTLSYGSFEVFHNHNLSSSETGWYWWPCWPGCLPDGEPTGPFLSSFRAYSNAQECA